MTATNERDELAKVIAKTDGSGHFLRNGRQYAYGPLADAILAAGYTKPRQVTTVAEMDGLGFESVVLDSYNTPYICERFRTDGTRAEWQQSGTSHLMESEEVLEHGPITVLYSPVAP